MAIVMRWILTRQVHDTATTMTTPPLRLEIVPLKEIKFHKTLSNRPNPIHRAVSIHEASISGLIFNGDTASFVYYPASDKHE